MNWLLKILYFFLPIKEQKSQPKPTPVNPVKGLLSMDLYGYKDKVTEILKNPMVIGAFNNKVDLSKMTGFPCYLETNSTQEFSLVMTSGANPGIRLDFHKTNPRLYAEKFFSVQVEIDYVLLTSSYIRISLVGLPDFYVNLK